MPGEGEARTPRTSAAEGGNHFGELSFNNSSNGGNRRVSHRIIVKNSTESHDNPFQENSELSKKADYIVRHSTISRSEIHIVDPDKTPEPTMEEPMLAASVAPTAAASPKRAGAGDIPVADGGAKENGKVDEPLSPQAVEVKVMDASLPPAGEAEACKAPKDKKCTCCVVQ